MSWKVTFKDGAYAFFCDVHPSSMRGSSTAGKAVKTMKLGTYTMVVRDRGRIHNAHVVAPGFNRKTTPLTYTGTQTWKVSLRKAGTLRFLCDPHTLVGMKGSAKIVP